MAAWVTIVRASFDAGSVRLRVNIPTAATSPSEVCANLRIANEPVTSGIEATSSSGLAGVGVVGASDGGDVGGSVGDVGDGSEGVVGGNVGDVGDGSEGVVGGSAGGVGVAGTSNAPVMGMTRLPNLA
jgi:hypothetical protein